MKNDLTKSFSRFLVTAVLMVFACSNTSLAHNSQQKASSKNLMPVSASSMLEAASMTDKELKKAMNVIIRNNGTSTYSDGRVARERVGDEIRVHTYQDDIEGHTVLTLNHKTKQYTIDQFISGRHESRLDPDGGYITFYNSDGTIKQQWIDAETLQVHMYEYDEHTVLETGPDGVLYPVRVLEKKYSYLSTADGNVLYSTTDYSKEGSVLVETTRFEGSLKMEVVKDGKLVQSVDENGLVTDYTYKVNKKGELVSRTGTREDGLMTVVKAKDLVVKKERVNFQRVLKAALKSMLDPGGRYEARTRNGSSYVFEAGSLSMLRTSRDDSYNFIGGILQSITDSTGKTVVRLKDGQYIRL